MYCIQNTILISAIIYYIFFLEIGEAFLLQEKLKKLCCNFSSQSMTSNRLGIPNEEFVNDSEEIRASGPCHNKILTTAAQLSNIMDVTQQRIACGVVTGVALLSAILGFLCMFAISQQSLSMMSKVFKIEKTLTFHVTGFLKNLRIFCVILRSSRFSTPLTFLA